MQCDNHCRLSDVKNKSVTEAQLLVVLHLIGCALHEEKRYIEEEDSGFHFTSKAENWAIPSLLDALHQRHLSEMHKDFLDWTLNQ